MMTSPPTPHPLAAAAALAALLLSAVVVLAACGSDDAALSDSSPSESSGARSEPDVAAVPVGLRWESYQGVKVPYGADGPAHTTGAGAVTGFTRTPPGAALAAIQQSIRLGTAPDWQWAAVAAAGVAPGVDRDAYAVARMQISITAPVIAAEAPRMMGYRFIDYTPERAAVTLYTEFPDGSFTATDVDLVWSGGDWRLLLPAPDATQVRVRVVDTLPVPGDRFVALEAL